MRSTFHLQNLWSQGNDLHEVALAQLARGVACDADWRPRRLRRRGRLTPSGVVETIGDEPRHPHKTSGASETIFMKFLSRNSRATGPKMRVPRGLFALSMITAAFSSKAIEVPSSRPNGLRVRTTTAWTTSPFLIAPWGVAVLTVAVITSPTRA